MISRGRAFTVRPKPSAANGWRAFTPRAELESSRYASASVTADRVVHRHGERDFGIDRRYRTDVMVFPEPPSQTIGRGDAAAAER